MCYIDAERVVDLCIAIVKVQRDFGNRADRKIARMKYLIHDWGIDRFKNKVEEYFGDSLEPLKPVHVHGFNDGMGWHEQGDGKWFYGLNIENGRIKDTETMQLKTALREICTTFRMPLRLTPHQSIIFCDIAPKIARASKKSSAATACRSPRTTPRSAAGRWPAPPSPPAASPSPRANASCPTSWTSSKSKSQKLGLEDEVFTTRMTGCPNGCARPYNSDIGLVGKTKDKYTIFLGGRVLGDRLNFIYKDLVPTAEVVPTLAAVLRYFKDARQPGESFGDFCHRLGKDALTRRLRRSRRLTNSLRHFRRRRRRRFRRHNSSMPCPRSNRGHTPACNL